MAERIVTLDFETYYDKEYSLSKLTTEEYIRSPQFEIILVGVREAYGEVQTFSGTHEEIREWLEQFDLPNAYLLCHNTAFDAAILKWRLGITPKYYLDTLSMSRPLTGNTVGGTLAKLAKQFMLGEKGMEVVNALGKHRHQFSPEELSRYAEYCANDVVLTFNLYNVLLQYTTPREQYLIDLHIRMFVDPVIELDARLLRGHLLSVRQRKEDLLRTVSVTTDELMSNNKFAEVLRGLGVEPPTKLSPRTGKTTFALAKSDMGMKELLNHPDERVQAVAAARLGVKSTLEETRTQAMVYIANRGPLPIMLHYYGAHTGRSSGGDKINPQNLPRGGKLRQAMRAPKGHVFVVADSSQIEARGVAWLAGQDDLVQGFAGGADLYSEFASDIYGRKIDRKREVTLPDGTVTKPDFVEGFVGKTCILGLGYGMGADKLHYTLKVGQGGMAVTLPDGEAERIVKLYRSKYAKLPLLWREAAEALERIVRGYEATVGEGIRLRCTKLGVHLPNGMMIRYPELARGGDGFKPDELSYRSRYGRTRIYGPKLIENVVQALARIVVFNQMATLDQQLRKHDSVQARHKIVLTVHDEVVAVVPKHNAAYWENQFATVMSRAPSWAAGLPIACEVGIAETYGDAK